MMSPGLPESSSRLSDSASDIPALRIDVAAVELELHRPLVTAARSYARRATWLVRVTDLDGMFGLGEAAPLPGHGGEAPEMVEPALGALARALALALADIFESASSRRTAPGDLIESEPTRSATPGNVEMLDPGLRLDRVGVVSISAAIRPAAPDAPCARAALELALCDLAARRAGLPLCDWLVADAQHQIPLNATIGAERPEKAAEMAADAVAAGFRAIKVKVGTGDDEDVERIAAIRAAVGDDILIRVDANGAWDRTRALAMCHALVPFDLEYLEQPVAANDVEGLAALRVAAIVPIAADEALLLPDGPMAVIEHSAADVWVLKPSLLGGPLQALDLAAQARRSGASIVVTSSLDSAVGRAGAAHVAAALGGLGGPSELHACGLATGAMFVRDVAVGHAIEHGRLVIPAAPGLGIGGIDEGLILWRSAMQKVEGE